MASGHADAPNGKSWPADALDSSTANPRFAPTVVGQSTFCRLREVPRVSRMERVGKGRKSGKDSEAAPHEISQVAYTRIATPWSVATPVYSVPEAGPNP